MRYVDTQGFTFNDKGEHKHCVKVVRIQSYCCSNSGKYGPE